jgi:hypothetical protein
MMIKHPIPLGVLGVAALAVYLSYGIWPFIVLAFLIFASVVGLMYLQIRSEAPPRVVNRTINIPTDEVGPCLRHPLIRATTILNVTRGNETVRLELCSDCARDAQDYIYMRQLTAR